MKFGLKSVLLVCLFTLPAILPVCAPAAYADEPVRLAEDVKVQVNDKLVQFPDAQPFVDENHKLQVPARVVADKLGYQLNWEPAGSEIKITIKDNKNSLSLQTGNKSVTVNGQREQLESAAEFVDGRVYVPVRLISDSFDIQTQWDNQNRIAILGADGNYHAPAWYRPSAAVQAAHAPAAAPAPAYSKMIEVKATAYTASPAENGGYGPVDYMGNPLRLGTIAVDPSVIPLGSKVLIKGYSYMGLPANGLYATATDTGGAIKGNRIDIFLPESRAQASLFGMQNVQVYVLNP
ncbi:3D (Asp-Asp-Asp) domain-containing protein [Paenibacillus tianmuensis]|uniref:3D (Asp-Asp-Asp) domain-containing protein n=1 Tax=Paenibacillus tianmuensis TaxID=624147 RepID=A0A1G4TB74_9BACL|nr:stalk domain-containing protein [Paenibacillus tianmuensis]SCW77819.1 3D (Asp-Asp-Asp) domain-containing protein [Paenibacillus tianmuensis]